MAIIGYARTLLPDDDVEGQVDALRSAGARRVFVDAGVPAGRQVRPEWEHCLDYLRDGEDTLIVVAADRIARGAVQLAEILTQLAGRGIGFRSLVEPALDTTTDSAAALLDLLGVVVALDRAGRAEDTRLGLTHARDQGRVGGRPTVITPELLDRARELRAGGATYSQIAQELGVGKTTIRRALTTPASML